MKVFIVSRGYPTEESPANGVFEFDQARSLAGAGAEVYFLSVDLRSFKRTRKWGFTSFNRDNVNVRGINIPIGPLPLKFRIPLGRWAYSRLLHCVLNEVGQPDVVHAHFADQGQYVLAKRDWLECPFVYTEHASGVLLDNPEYLTFAPPVWKEADAVLAVSGALAKEMKRIARIKPKVIWNVVNTGIFGKAKPEVHDYYEFVSAGNCISGKNHSSLIRAFSAATKQTDMKLKLVIFGDGDRMGELKALVEELGLQDSVELRGMHSREEMAREYSHADCFALASRCETFGVAYAEAMAAGLPIIATKCGGPEDFVTSDCGLLVDKDNDESLAIAMQEMAAHSRLRYSAETIQKRVGTLFAPEVIAAKLIRTYQEQIEIYKMRRS